MQSPWISLTTQAASKPAHDLYEVLVASISPAATLLIFFLGTWVTMWQASRQRRDAAKQLEATLEREREKDREAREYEKQRDRDTRRLDTKRDVILQVAPAVVRVYGALGQVMNFDIPDQKLGDLFGSGSEAMSRLQAVADDETLKAAQELMAAMGVAFVKLMKVRAYARQRNESNIDIVKLWASILPQLIPLLGNMVECARKEIGLGFDRAAFERGLRATNEAVLAEYPLPL